MTENEIKHRLQRIYTAFGEKSSLNPEDIQPVVKTGNDGYEVTVDFSGGKSAESLEIDAASIINEIMGIRDRAKTWVESQGGDKGRVDNFIRSELSVALVHDLANTDKHGKLDRPPFSGHKPTLEKVSRAATLKYDPVSRTYPSHGSFESSAFDAKTGSVGDKGTSTNIGITLISDIVNESGEKVGELQKVLPEAIYLWEQFLTGEGLALS